ncbi:hypothetical protein DICVIV_10069 [Dictyocaulus viviparus]|uniref:Major facilitator superfamily (MFS) profile domain-containing protein n=1 Tax=Dictyocaulus viviparus TaxID=29172 RepID=A0A0D8XH35_DICVI|nr:hypothetical protein DICVIV_10069 [Dictyocaulus viviparus]
MGYANAYPNTAVNGFRMFLNKSMKSTIEETTFSWLWSAILNVYFIGFISGSVFTIPIADHIGRKWCLVFGNVTNFIAAFLTSLSIAYFMPSLFVLSRIIFAVGAAISMNSLILLLQESAELSLRGLMSFNAEMAFVITNALGALAGMDDILGNNLVILVGLPCIPSFLSIVVSLYFHESPRFLFVKKNDRKKAGRAIKFYQGIDEQSITTILSSYEAETSTSYGSIKELCLAKHVRKGLFLGWYIHLFFGH